MCMTVSLKLCRTLMFIQTERTDRRTDILLQPRCCFCCFGYHFYSWHSLRQLLRCVNMTMSQQSLTEQDIGQVVNTNVTQSAHYRGDRCHQDFIFTQLMLITGVPGVEGCYLPADENINTHMSHLELTRSRQPRYYFD